MPRRKQKREIAVNPWKQVVIWTATQFAMALLPELGKATASWVVRGGLGAAGVLLWDWLFG